MAKTITSPNVTFMDVTDNRKLDVYITSNLPTVQIKNINTNPVTYTPNWTSTPLKLEADAYLDSQDVTSKTTFSWYKKGTNGQEVLINSNSQSITINTNDLDNSQLMIYICKALYKASNVDIVGVEDVEQITFSQVTTGINGIDGEKGDKGDQGIQGVQGEQGLDGKTSYFHIKYSANANGNPMSEEPSTYIGTYVDYTEADSTDYTKYTWSRFIGSQGPKGDQGIAGSNGEDGLTSYLHIAYATSANGSTGFSVSDSVGKTYIGQYTDHTQTDSTDYTKYKWTLIKGDKGDQGVQGPKGNDGQQLYTWIKYADTPTSGMSNSPDGKTYIGLAYNKTTATESGTYSDYMWSLIKGETGPTGPKGADGQQYYTWIKYADNASGDNMSDSPTGKLYIGLAYNKTTNTESNTASDYTWALFKGDKGETGAIGAPGADAVTFQVYSSSGYALSINTPTVTLQTFAYVGDVAITADATYQWYMYNDSGWTAISGAANAYLTITREDVIFSKSYMCKMVFNGVEYTDVATIDDKNDENKVFTTKPSNYVAGDLWIVGVDYAPAGIEVGTLLKAEHTNTAYEDADWVTSLKYDDKITELENNMRTYNQYFSFDSTDGLKISAKDDNGTPSQFSTSLTNERLSFNYGNEAIAYINGTKMNIKEAEIESPLTVTGKYSGSTMLQAPVINIGKFSIIVESNGSLSIVANT